MYPVSDNAEESYDHRTPEQIAAYEAELQRLAEAADDIPF